MYMQFCLLYFCFILRYAYPALVTSPSFWSWWHCVTWTALQFIFCGCVFGGLLCSIFCYFSVWLCCHVCCFDSCCLFFLCCCFFTVLIYFLLQLSLWYFVAFALVVLGICLYNVWPPSEYSKAQRLQIEEPYEDSSSEAESIIVPTSSWFFFVFPLFSASWVNMDCGRIFVLYSTTGKDPTFCFTISYLWFSSLV